MFTFANLKNQLLKHDEKEGMWEITNEKKGSFTFVYRHSDEENRYEHCEEMETSMTKRFGIPCLAYRQYVWSKDRLYKETYRLIFEHEEKLVELVIETKKRGNIQPFVIIWCQLDEKWIETEFRETLIRPDMEEAFIDMIEDLPEFRLHAVTGMLAKKERY